jgi:hypothetical protein
MLQANKTKRISANIFHVWIQELPNKFYVTNHHGIETFEDQTTLGI